MIISQQTTSLLDQAKEADGVREVSLDDNAEAKGYSPLTMTVPFSERLSEQWLLERTYHAQLRNGRELSVPHLTLAMKQITGFYVPLSTWREISQEEAHATYQQGIPVLLYGEHSWENRKGASGIDYAVGYLDLNRGTFSNTPSPFVGTPRYKIYRDVHQGTFSDASWRAGFSSGAATVFERSNITFLSPWMQFPYTTHYTVIASDGHVHEYADRAGAMEGFHTLPPRQGSGVQTVFPQFCYYHEVRCPSGVYRLEFFGSRMDEQGYKVKEAE